MDTSQQQQLDLTALAQQVLDQAQLLQQLLAQQQPLLQNSGSVPLQPQLHDLPTRPSYAWQPDATLLEQVPTLANTLFSQTLSDVERKAIVDRYPAMQGLKYSPPATLPEASRKFSRGQQREDATLQGLQYSASAVFRPLDVLTHELQRVLPSSEAERIFTIINDARTLVLHLCGSANVARNGLALRVINPFLKLTTGQEDYTMARSDLQEALN
ncbi:hypothetical protein EC973_001827 [Apophysomyces ossiformis]|uniref:Uncharacterized protein n=1 Tax=Apophysomyces ossiformis TaxID=679940 RepID=A0A8H7BJ52_9FUNG|nr:hypothetical protein EC973_001827 [Apophysomyces ossiformis]